MSEQQKQPNKAKTTFSVTNFSLTCAYALICFSMVVLWAHFTPLEISEKVAITIMNSLGFFVLGHRWGWKAKEKVFAEMKTTWENVENELNSISEDMDAKYEETEDEDYIGRVWESKVITEPGTLEKRNAAQ